MGAKMLSINEKNVTLTKLCCPRIFTELQTMVCLTVGSFQTICITVRSSHTMFEHWIVPQCTCLTVGPFHNVFDCWIVPQCVWMLVVP